MFILAAVVFVLVLLCPKRIFAYNAERSDLTGGLDGIEMAKKVACEGMVLLKNSMVDSRRALPLEKGESVAVFGINQIDFIYGGGGSGNFDSQNERVGYVSLYDALKEKESHGEVRLYGELTDLYKKYYDDYWKNDGRTYAYGTRQGALTMFVGEMEITREQVKRAAEFASTAIIAIGRPAGEDGDRSSGEGDFELNEKERNIVSYVKSADFSRVIVILNSTGVMASDWIKDDGIDAAIMASLPGMAGGAAMADVLFGDAYPSGKLVDTWAGRYEDYPSAANFGNSEHTDYVEDIFVGYRYFETIPNKDKCVNFPFGFGLSYADFEMNDASLTVKGEGRDRKISASVLVTNRGEYAGKEVVQLYAALPENKLTQPKRRLAAFYKTRELKAGESELVNIVIPFDTLKSYDDVGKTEFEAAYVLEEGVYDFYIGNSVRDCVKSGEYTLEKTECVEQLKHHLVPDTAKFSKRMKSDGSFETIPQRENAPVSDDPKEDVDAAYKEIYTAKGVDSGKEFITFNDLVNAFAGGDENADKLLHAFVARLTDDEAIKLTGCTPPIAGKGHRTGLCGIDVYGLPIIGTSNGPAGIQYNGSKGTWETTTTFYPCATMQAMTWNEKLIEQLGAAMADEARHFDMSLWQAPGMNIHRNPLCGRNFEYFAEDPLVAGKMGAAITRGVQSKKFASQIKHFACNNQELGRWGNDSRLSERAVREIYLKGFELAVREGGAWSVMSSYNRINGTQASGNYQLLTEILRNEWGFDGFVMTDFRTANVTHAEELASGGDVKAPADSPRPANVHEALKTWLPRWKVLRSAERVLRFALKTEDASDLLGKEFKYSVALNVANEKIAIDGKIRLKDNITWGEFKNSILGRYNQTYSLIGSDGNEITDGETPLAVGMSVVVTAQDRETFKTFEISQSSIATNCPAKASHVESKNYTPDKAFDGDKFTRWSGFEGNYIWGHWIEVDLKEEYHLSRIELSYFGGERRSYDYEIYTADKSGEKYWSDASKNRDFVAQGYDLAASSCADHIALKTENIDKYARFVAVKTTGSVGAYGASLCSVDVFGWRIESDEYTIDEKNKSITIKPGDTTGDAMAKIRIIGGASLDFAGSNNTWLNDGDKIVITDQNGAKTEYTVIAR